MRTELTIHSVVKNEPFIYYSIKSVYPYADSILLYDTGSTDATTLEDIHQLLREDKDKKIIFKQVPIETDELHWNIKDITALGKQNKGKFGVGKVRHMQLQDTFTDYCMLVDGDEVHYRSTMEAIVSMLPGLKREVYCVGIPLIWFYNLNTLFNPGCPLTGRILRTVDVGMNDESPNERHTIKRTGETFTINHPNYLIMNGLQPYAHFETYLKPWRQAGTINMNTLAPFRGKLPEVMEADPRYMLRFKPSAHTTGYPPTPTPQAIRTGVGRPARRPPSGHRGGGVVLG